MTTIMIVEDEWAIARVLDAYCKKRGWHTVMVEDGHQVMAVFLDASPDLVLLDVMLPGRDGWSILSEIRERSDCPVVMLTALDELDDRLKGFDGGADDYIAKPFHGEEVVARIAAVLKRQPSEEKTDAMEFGDLEIRDGERRVYLSGKQVELTPKDTALLIHLAKHPNRVWSRDELIEHVWGWDYTGSDRAVDLAVKRIRQALRKWDDEHGGIRTIRGEGYSFHAYT
ncbi:response regulator transcription factor [Salisediminibacterium selenitireducens]|uniref:response regulator transcription factor n=1 Tax=Salisediminibacterium selenitireducens TaxID=85683 RepID=UPI000BA9D26A|nr:response regulator transcription factor [Salisediminibacterium selenitireducens]